MDVKRTFATISLSVRRQAAKTHTHTAGSSISLILYLLYMRTHYIHIIFRCVGRGGVQLFRTRICLCCFACGAVTHKVLLYTKPMRNRCMCSFRIWIIQSKHGGGCAKISAVFGKIVFSKVFQIQNTFL